MRRHSECFARSLGIPTLLAFLVLATGVNAQPPAPLVTHVFPAGGQRGQTFEATVFGANLQGAVDVRINGPGVTTKVLTTDKADQVKFSVSLAADAPMIERDIRVLTPGGISNRARFLVGDLVEMVETEPNSEPSQVQVIPELPRLINGQLTEPDRDYYRFSAKAGQTVVCAFEGRNLLPYIPDAVPGWIDGYLSLRDASGKELAVVDDTNLKPDPVLCFPIPADGDYTLEVRDSLYRGRPTFVYRLSLGVLPHVGSVFPLGGPRTAETDVEWKGVNLPAGTSKLPAFGGPDPWRMVGWTQQAPASNLLAFGEGDYPEIRETEPNDAPDKATRLPNPGTANGRIQTDGDSDFYVITAKGGQPLAIDVMARRLGSPLDSLLEVWDSKGGVLQRIDDYTDVDPGQALLAHQADSRTLFTPPSDGDYLVRVKNMQPGGSDEHAYRLSVGPPKPDYVLEIIPDSYRLGKGETVSIPVKALRLDGFGGEISLEAVNPPPGFVCSGGVIPAGQDQARLTLTAPADASAGAVPLTIVGKSKLGEAEVSRNAVPCEDVMQAFSLHHMVPTRELLAAVIEPVGFSLTTSQAAGQVVEAAQGSKLTFVVKAARIGEAKGPINLTLDAPPPGLTLDPSPTVIGPDQAEATVTMTLAGDAAVGARWNVVLSGSSTTPQGTWARLTPGVLVKVVAPPPPAPAPAPAPATPAPAPAKP